jgi:hypothetical protein
MNPTVHWQVPAQLAASVQTPSPVVPSTQQQPDSHSMKELPSLAHRTFTAAWPDGVSQAACPFRIAQVPFWVQGRPAHASLPQLAQWNSFGVPAAP